MSTLSTGSSTALRSRRVPILVTSADESENDAANILGQEFQLVSNGNVVGGPKFHTNFAAACGGASDCAGFLCRFAPRNQIAQVWKVLVTLMKPFLQPPGELLREKLF